MELSQDMLKTGYNKPCQGCLSRDRKIYPLGHYLDLFLHLTGDQRSMEYRQEDLKFCWECIARLKNIKNFQTQLKQAQNNLLELYYGGGTPSTLSKLTIAKSTHLYEYSEIQSDHIIWKRGDNNLCIDVIKDEDNIIKTEFSCNSDNSLMIENESNSIIYEHDKPDEDRKSDGNKYTLTFENDDDKFSNEQTLIEILSDSINSDHDYKNEDDFKDDDIKNDNAAIKVERKTKTRATIREKIKENVNYHRAVYKKNVKIIDVKENISGDKNNYFKMTTFDESEIEEHILVKERPFKDLAKYKYCCKSCKLGYKILLDLLRHNDINHQNMSTYKCTCCKKVLPSHDELIHHWREHTAIAQCKLCDQFMKPMGMSLHLRLSHSKMYACSSCGMMFPSFKTFGKHFKGTHMKYICDYCNITLKSKKRIIRHIRMNHIPKDCKECNRRFIHHRSYEIHCVTYHPAKVNKDTDAELRFCVECNIQFQSMATYTRHLQTSVKHTDVRPKRATCPECGKMFAKLSNMKNHFNLYHLKKTNHYCQICDKYFARAFGLRKHNDFVHLKKEIVKNKICDICGRGFGNNRVLRNHRATHTGEKFHKCMYCTAEFIQKHAMQTHMRTQHKDNA